MRGRGKCGNEWIGLVVPQNKVSVPQVQPPSLFLSIQLVQEGDKIRSGDTLVHWKKNALETACSGEGGQFWKTCEFCWKCCRSDTQVKR